MAIFNPGIAVGQISGKVGGTVFSRNRGGAYIRNNAIPVNPATVYQENQRARIATFSAAWAALTSVQQLAWKNWATQNPVINRLGNSISLSGHQAFVQLNVNIALAAGSQINVPPVVAPPNALDTITGLYDIGAGDFELQFTPTPIGASNHLAVEVAVVDNPGVSFVQNLYKQVIVTAANQATDVDLSAVIATRFGTLMVGQRVFYRVAVLDSATGLRSVPLTAWGTIVST